MPRMMSYQSAALRFHSVSGSAATQEEIVAVEQLWKRKLQSRAMGLNKN